MITEIRADGFRSLDNFTMAVRPGLNVLVGPNGGGKTNILALFTFLSALASDELGDAISSSGGVSKVFKKLDEGSFQKSLSVGVTGTYDVLSTPLYLTSAYRKVLNDAGVQSVDYEWDCFIDASHGYDQAFFSEQKLQCRVNLASDGSVRRTDYDFALIIKTITGGISFDEEIINPERSALIHQSSGENEEGLFTVTSGDLRDSKSLSNTFPVFHLYAEAEILRWLSWDVRGGATFNFDPASCKLPNDSAQSPTLERDGSGLAAIVYAIQKAEYSYGPNVLAWQRHFEKGTDRNLQRYFGLINPSLRSVHAKNDPLDNRITVYVSVGAEGDKSIDFPLEFASDGTVKWLAFNVALLTHKSGFSIEEPENFLHPEIQRHAVELVRAEMGDDQKSFVLMTTHSESLLNAARPDEIIVVSMEDGVTQSKRVADPHLISEEIRETGFGLGYYYISGALHG